MRAKKREKRRWRSRWSGREVLPPNQRQWQWMKESQLWITVSRPLTPTHPTSHPHSAHCDNLTSMSSDCKCDVTSYCPAE